MKPTPDASTPDLKNDMKTFEKLPAHTKELSALKDHAEKTTGIERMRLDKKIRVRSKNKTPPNHSHSK
jgi:hypothetical protein